MRGKESSPRVYMCMDGKNRSSVNSLHFAGLRRKERKSFRSTASLERGRECQERGLGNKSRLPGIGLPVASPLCSYIVCFPFFRQESVIWIPCYVHFNLFRPTTN